MLGIADYLWRLAPGNPILRRVVESAGKKRRDAVIRGAYLAILIIVVMLQLFSSGNDYSSGDLAKLNKGSTELFQVLSYMQLGLVALLSPIFTAGAITQEKDSQTYDILLTTPLTNGQILLGSLLSRVFFVIALLISGIPIFCITQIFGGVSVGSIFYSFLIAACTAILTGAMAISIATFKIGTRRTIFSFYLFIVVYMVGLYLLDNVDALHLHLIDASGNAMESKTSWLTGLNPFLALHALFNDRSYLPPELADLPPGLRAWPLSWYWTSPSSFYCVFTLVLSLGMVLPSIVLLRRLAQSTGSLRAWLLRMLRLRSGDRTRKPRPVWQNPVAWREARTKASAARATLLRYGFIIIGLGAAVVLLVLHSSERTPPQYTAGLDATRTKLFIAGDNERELTVTPSTVVKFTDRGDAEGSLDDLSGKWDVRNVVQDANGAVAEIDLADFPRSLPAEQARTWLLGLTIVEVSVILLIISNAAASAVTREKEDGTLDLLLSTPITSRYYIWGKLRGLVSFVLPLLAVPVVSALLFVIHDLLRWLPLQDTHFQWIVLPEALLMMPAMLIIICAMAAMVGMQMSLRCRTTVRAVMSSVGIVVGVCAAMGWCGYGMISRSGMSGDFAAGLGAFSPFTLLTLLIDPWDYGGASFDVSSGAQLDPSGARMFVAVLCAIALTVYAAAVWSMYKSMVRNFDMTIRKQSQ